MRAMTPTAQRAQRAPRSGKSTAGILTSESAAGWKPAPRGETRVGRASGVRPRVRIGGRGMAAVEAKLGSRRNGLMILVRQKLHTRRLACALLLAACQIDFTAAAPAGCGVAYHFVDQCRGASRGVGDNGFVRVGRFTKTRSRRCWSGRAHRCCSRA